MKTIISLLKTCLVAVIAVITTTIPTWAEPILRSDSLLTDGWQFTLRNEGHAEKWQQVRVPHDWAITGPFDIKNDLQRVAVKQNGETKETLKTGRTGGLPYIGRGEYRATFHVADTTHHSTTLIFDGAMSHAHVKVNGKEVMYWPYGYNSFHVNIDGVVKPGKNELQVNLENKTRQSRWYAGAGLYRNVHVLTTSKVHIDVWGTHITTPHVTIGEAQVDVTTQLTGAKDGEVVTLHTQIIDPYGRVAAQKAYKHTVRGQQVTQQFLVSHPALWDTDAPHLYKAITHVSMDGKQVDRSETRFGIRKLEYIAHKGFFLNGKLTKFKGVCNHHDLGPLGAAINRSALRYRISLLKDMGANAIRTSHNMPSPELVELCDEMGMMLMIEPFDDWGFRPKSPNGYGAVFADWAEKDITNMVKHYRNNPSVVMWSIGNEVPSQWSPQGIKELTMLQDLVHSLDATRPVTCGMDQIRAILDNGFAAALDIPGFNYKPQHYERAYEKLPQGLILGSETASTVSSRGVYHFPVLFRGQKMVTHDDHQSSSYDCENCSWSNTPDIDFAMDEDKPYVIGQFVWTGFDYLGEPSPYDTDAWPNHSSVFGIIDLATLPKDRFYLYRSVWNKKDATLHVLPHWTWPGREGETTPVFVYTSYPKAELFVNGKSQGMKSKNDSTLTTRYRLMWNDVKYEPGELRVVAYDYEGRKAEEKVVRTAGKAHQLVATLHHPTLQADGQDLAYITIQATDKEGNILPTDSSMVHFEVSGAGTFEATANGDPTCLLPFHKPAMKLFSGAATAIVRAKKQPGIITFTAKAKGVKPAKVKIEVK